MELYTDTNGVSWELTETPSSVSGVSYSRSVARTSPSSLVVYPTATPSPELPGALGAPAYPGSSVTVRKALEGAVEAFAEASRGRAVPSPSAPSITRDAKVSTFQTILPALVSVMLVAGVLLRPVRP